MNDRRMAQQALYLHCDVRTFVTFGILNELEFTPNITRKFLKDWGVHHCLLSVAFPRSNCLAEVVIKTVKRLISDNLGIDGDIDTDAFQLAMLQCRYTPDRDTKVLLAVCVWTSNQILYTDSTGKI